MKFSADFLKPRIDIEKYKKLLEKHMTAVLTEALAEWLMATVVAEVPLWSGASRATFVALANNIQFRLETGPPAPGCWTGSRVDIGMASSTGDFKTEIGRGRYVFSYSTTLPWLVFNEYHNANAILNPKTGAPYFHLRKPGPYHFQEKGKAAFVKYAATVRLPSPFSCLSKTKSKVR